MASSSVPPTDRAAFVVKTSEFDYVWDGFGDKNPETVFICCNDTETWTRQITKGPHPSSGLCDGGCCTSKCLYFFGSQVGLLCNCVELFACSTGNKYRYLGVSKDKP